MISINRVSRIIIVAAVTVIMMNASRLSQADDAVQVVHPIAILPFQERGAEVREMGVQVSDLLFANLVSVPNLFLVDRENLKTMLDEQELSLSGVVNSAEAVQVGRLTGAKILPPGSVLEVDSKLHVVAKIIGTETSRVLGDSVKADTPDGLSDLAEELAKRVVKTLNENADSLVAKPVSSEDRLAEMPKRIPQIKHRLPAVAVRIAERHIGESTIDPAAETEIAYYCDGLGMSVSDSVTKRNQADILLTGEAFSELATRHGNLISIQARVELKAVDVKSGDVLTTASLTKIETVELVERARIDLVLQEQGLSMLGDDSDSLLIGHLLRAELFAVWDQSTSEPNGRLVVFDGSTGVRLSDQRLNARNLESLTESLVQQITAAIEKRTSSLSDEVRLISMGTTRNVDLPPQWRSVAKEVSSVLNQHLAVHSSFALLERERLRYVLQENSLPIARVQAQLLASASTIVMEYSR